MTEAMLERPRHGRHQRRASQTTARRAWRVLSRLIAAVVLALIALVVVGHVRGYESLIVLSGSMGKAAPVGSLVVAKPMAAQQVQVGTIVLLRENGQAPVLHRVVEREEIGRGVVVHTKGDANPGPDPFTTHLSGTVITPILVLPGLGYVLSWFQTPTGWVALILAPLLIAGLFVLLRKWTSIPPKHTAEAVGHPVEQPASWR